MKISSKLSHPGNLLLAGFGAMILMMSTLVYLSVRQKIPMVSKNYYEQELKYQQTLDAMNNTNNYDSLFSVKVLGDQIALSLPPALSNTLQEGSVYFYCPSDETKDYRAKLDSKPDGQYTFNRSSLAARRYILKISLMTDGVAYYKEMPFSL